MDDHLFLDQLLTLPTVRQAQLSPDGRWVAFDWQRVHANTDVFLVPTDGSAPPSALTHTPEFTELVNWAPDSRAVIVQEDHNGDERASLFRVALEQPGVMIPLTPASPPYFIRGGVLSPDGSSLYYGANYDFEQECLIEPTWMYRHDLSSGARRVLARPLKPAFTLPQLNIHGTRLIYARKDRHPSGRQFHLVDIRKGDDREILNFGAASKVFARWFPDGENLLVIAEQLEANGPAYVRLGRYHCPSGRLEWLVDDPSRNIESARVSPDGLVILDELVAARHQPSFLDPTSGVETGFPSLAGNLMPLGRAADGGWIALHYSATSPVDLVRLVFGGEGPFEMRSLTGAWERTDLDASDLAPAEAFAWDSVDGLRIHGWLYRAVSNPGRAIIYIHGGPSSHSEDKLNPEIQYLVRRGFNVLDANYRGSTGYGLAFREAIKADGWGGREQEDIAAGARALIASGLAQPGRIGVTGTSYGGYSAWCQITRFPAEVIGAAAPICGMTDLVVDYQTTRPDLRPLSEEMLGGSPQQVPQRYYERSPIHFVGRIRSRAGQPPALLIVQGAQDPNVTPENVRQVIDRLEAQQVAYELLVFEDEGHGIARPANQARLFERLADFFAAALQEGIA